ncbi:MAG: RraA family protein [Chloroflexi bacterium]|nr:RraA family protein [Chloroflexota bacterium]
MTKATAPLTAEQLAAITRLDTPTIANALEELNIRPRTEGFMRPEIRCVSPVNGTVVGYAVTGLISARHRSPKALGRADYWNAIVAIPAPRMVVLHDIDYPDCIGSYWGEVQGNTALGLDCVGAVTDGGVRDLKEAQEMGFPFWAKDVMVSHGYIHALEFNVPIGIGGVLVRPGDLIAADIHGVIEIPLSAAPKLPEVARMLTERESIVIKAARAAGASPETLGAAWNAASKIGAEQTY